MKYLKEQVRQEFIRYLRALTDNQVKNVYQQEDKANRPLFAALAMREIERRGIEARKGKP